MADEPRRKTRYRGERCSSKLTLDGTRVERTPGHDHERRGDALCERQEIAFRIPEIELKPPLTSTGQRIDVQRILDAGAGRDRPVVRAGIRSLRDQQAPPHSPKPTIFPAHRCS
jgi:hypothetical protein